MKNKLIRLSSWAALAAIVFVTVSPIGLRPEDIFPVDVDRALAFAGLAALFVLAYPRHWRLVGIIMITGAAAIELLQLLSPTRHARLDDAMVKSCGALIGVVTAWAINILREEMKRSQHRRRRSLAQREVRRRPMTVTEGTSLEQLPVTSKMIDAVYFSKDDGRLVIRFRNGEERLFSGVEETEARALVNANSPGKHYVDHIRPKYRRHAA